MNNEPEFNIKQVVIWGHKLHTHTHSYIHYGFFKAFNKLGYNTLWIDDSYDLKKINFQNSLFITDGQVDNKIPILNDCYYILHNCDLTKYKMSNVNALLLHVYTKDCLKFNVKKIAKYIYYEEKTLETEYPILYMPWATDLLPHEIDENMKNIYSNVLQKNTNNVNFVGLLTEEWVSVKFFCAFNGLKFTSVGGFNGDNIDSQINQELIQDSYIAPSIQTKWQIDNGYIPSRIFKNISYGKMGITNNETVAELFNGNIIYNKDILRVLEMGMDFEKYLNTTVKKAKILNLMEYVKQEHTYLNRIKVILKCINV